MLHKESVMYSWLAPEFEYKEKNKRWYIIALAGIAFGIIASIFFKNYLFAVMILIAGFLMLTTAKKEPLEMQIEVSEQGIKIHDVMHPYSEILAFWIKEDLNQNPVLLIATNKRINPLLSVPIDSRIDILELREYLIEFSNEQEMREPLTDRIIQKIGF